MEIKSGGAVRCKRDAGTILIDNYLVLLHIFIKIISTL